MEWKLSQDRKSEYDRFAKSAQDLEFAIGSADYRKSKLIDLRKDIDKGIKEWWDKIAKELNLDAKGDYMLSNEGVIKEVPKQQQPTTVVNDVAEVKPESKVGTNASELK